jgi:pyrroloquinoline quinone (PQQ) biosynthesis protein C
MSTININEIPNPRPRVQDAKKVMVSLAQLADVQTALATLVTYNIVKPESVIKGCKKFIAEHPEINEYLASKFMCEQAELEEHSK